MIQISQTPNIVMFLILCLCLIFKGIISLVIGRLANGCPQYQGVYGLQLYHPLSGEIHWLHQDCTMSEVPISYYQIFYFLYIYKHCIIISYFKF